MENNPVKTKNLNNLTSTQFSKLVQGIKDKKFRVVSWQGTILMDLLEYAQRLVARGSSSHHSQLVFLQTLNTEQPKELTKIQPQANNSQIPAKNPSINTYLLAGGLILLLGSVLALGYWLGKRKKPNLN